MIRDDNFYNSQQVNKRFLEDGRVMKNKKVCIFKLFGGYYTTNFNRNKKYSMDDVNWKVDEEKGFFWKLLAVLEGKVKRL